MPLSDHEQKILTDLEESLARDDPRFARNIGNIGLIARRRRIMSAVGFSVGLALLLAFFTVSIAAGLAGLGIMLTSSLAFVRTLTLSRASPR
jgi:Protein of unknown function (DUF3040)